MLQLRITNLRMPVEASEQELPGQLAARLSIRPTEIRSWRILRKSLDARARSDLKFVYTVAIELPDDSRLRQRLLRKRDVAGFLPEHFEDPDPGRAPLEHRPVIVGSGPAGLLAGYYLALKGYRPVIIERGHPVKERVPAIRAFDHEQAPHQPENNYLFGEGGAGCFSDGKLTCRMSGPDVDWVLQAFVDCGGRESIRYEYRPHLGSNRLPLICRNFRKKIESLGGEYRFQCCLEDLLLDGQQLIGIATSSGTFSCRQLILATGHSARDTYEMLFRSGLLIEQKAFQLGLRIEHPQENVNRWKYGRPEYLELLGAADYSLIARGRQDMYSFCMCAGGYVIPSISEAGHFCTNGMSNSRHDTPFANSGLMVTLQPDQFGSSHPLAGMELQRRYEAAAFRLGQSDYLCPIQSAQDFLQDRVLIGEATLPSSYQRGTVRCDLREVLPPGVLAAIKEGLPILDAKWKGRFLKQATLVGPEMRGSSPVRFPRDRSTRESENLSGLYPVGEGAGFAGGIISAAVDGLRTAREIVRRYAPTSAM